MKKRFSAILLGLLVGCAVQSRTVVVEKTSDHSFFGWTFPAEGEPNKQKILYHGPRAQLREQGHLHSYWAFLQS